MSFKENHDHDSPFSSIYGFYFVKLFYGKVIFLMKKSLDLKDFE